MRRIVSKMGVLYKNAQEKVNFEQIGIIGLVMIFFSIPALFSYDSTNYVKYLEIFEGNYSWGAWGSTRGWGYPLFLWISKILFGEFAQGVNVANFLIFLVWLWQVKKIIISINSDWKISQICLMISVLLVFNPIAQGYYHYLLTEALAATLSAVCMGEVLIIQKKSIEIEMGWKDIAKKILLVAISTIVLYQIKQMFFIIPILIFVLSEFFLIIIKKGKVLFSIGGLFIIVILFFSSIKLWNNFIAEKRVKDEVVMSETPFDRIDRSSERFFNAYIVKGATNFEYDSKKKVIKVKDNDIIIDTIPYEGEFNQVKYIIKCFTKHPFLLLGGYFDRYGAMTNVYRLERLPDLGVSGAKVVKDISFIRGYENENLACKVRNYHFGKNTFSDSDGRVKQYGSYVDRNIVINTIYSDVMIKIYNFIHTISFVYAPIGMIVHMLIFIFRRKKEETMYHGIMFVLTGTSFLYGMAITVMAMQIDRYLFPVFVFASIACILDIRKSIKSILVYLKNRGLR